LGLLHFFKKITMKILHGRLAFKEEIKWFSRFESKKKFKMKSVLFVEGQWNICSISRNLFDSANHQAKPEIYGAALHRLSKSEHIIAIAGESLWSAHRSSHPLAN
jgi:hypothetical protein